VTSGDAFAVDVKSDNFPSVTSYLLPYFAAVKKRPFSWTHGEIQFIVGPGLPNG
jgi:hypothetical protein